MNEMVREAMRWIEQMRKKGVEDGVIAGRLRESGWTEQQIDGIVRAVDTHVKQRSADRPADTDNGTTPLGGVYRGPASTDCRASAEQAPEQTNEMDAALVEAVHRRDADEVQALLAQGANPDGDGQSRHSPLTWALESPPTGCPDCAIALVEAGAALVLEDGESVVGQITRVLETSSTDAGPQLSLLRGVLEAGAPASAASLHRVVTGSTPECVEAARLLLSAGVEPDEAARPDDSALCRVARHRTGLTDLKLEMVAVLLAGGSKPSRQALVAALHAGCMKTVQLLVQNGADIDDVDAKGYTILHELASKRGGSAATARALVEMGADVGALDAKGRKTPLHLTISYGQENIAMMKALLSCGAPLDANGESPVIHEAIADGGLEALRVLLDHGEDVDRRRYDGGPTAISAALETSRWSPEKFTLLLERGADVNPGGGYEGRSPLHTACLNGRSEEVEVLLKRGALVDARDDMGRTPLLAAAHDMSSGNCLTILKLLIDAGADVNAEDSKARTPLHWVSLRQGHTVRCEEAARLLLDSGANIDAVDSDGHTPLAYAQVYEAGISDLLLAHGAAPSAQVDGAP